MGLFDFLRKRRLSPVKAEIANLHAAINQTDRYMADLIDSWCGICCPNCEFPILNDLELKQHRRQERLEQLKAKLVRDAVRANR